MPPSLRHHISVVSPFLDKRHGTERCVVEQIERLVRDYGYEVTIYSQQVEDLPVLASSGESDAVPGCYTWRRIPKMPGPHLLNYLWWFVANHAWRWWDTTVGRSRSALVFSPGINCLDADVIAVHIVFAEFYQRVRAEVALRQQPVQFWPRLLHRRLYYSLVIALERLLYTRQGCVLTTVSQKVTSDLVCHYHRSGAIPVIYHGIASGRFTPEQRGVLRIAARQSLGLTPDSFVLLLIGNDWMTKGLPCLLEAIAQLHDPSVQLLIVGNDDRTPFAAGIAERQLAGQVRFLPPRADVEWYYAAADVYVGPSLEDAFALPPAEAMACGLPVIVSSQAGVSELITDGVDGFVLQDPKDAATLAQLIGRLASESDLRRRMGERASITMQQYTWDKNAAELHALIQEVLKRKGKL